MNIGIIGSGIVGQTVGGQLVALGHDVVLGTRDPGNLHSAKGMAGSLANWLAGAGHGARVATFAEAAAHGAVVLNATSGTISVEALSLAGAENLAGKVLIDLANELDFSHGMPPVCLATDQEDGSVGGRIQRAFPSARVVKALNTMSAPVMVNPQQLAEGDHTVFICGNDAAAKDTVAQLLRSFGWRDIFDLGDITAAHGPEMLMALWVRCWQQLGNVPFNVKLVR
jgi:8-hydroxy-5-deazaflavin:NADPH oxidoreductase